MTVAIYARVSSDSQEARGTIGSQLDALRQKMVGLGHQVIHEYTDDGYSGTRLDRPGWMHFAMPPKPASSNRCGASPLTGSLAAMRTRSSSPTNWPGTASVSTTWTLLRFATIPRPRCWFKCKV